jgi:cell division protein FtsB
MPIPVELKAKISDPTILAEVEKLGSVLDEVTQESLGRKAKLKDFESKFNTIAEKAKKVGLNLDEDLESQLSERIEKSKTGLKPASEVEELSKTVKGLKDEIKSWKDTATRKEEEAILERARSAFMTKLPDHFGDATDILLDYALMKKQIASKDGVPGVVNGEDFYPLNVQKGQKSAIDVLKELYPKFVITKQVTGGKDVSTRIASSDGNPKTLTLEEFDSLPSQAAKDAFVASVKKGQASFDK